MKDLVVFGDPNGAGKTTAAPRILRTLISMDLFLNADEIAQGISPSDPEASAIAAGRLMVDRIRRLAQTGESFAFETTCAGRTRARLIRSCRERGYRVTLLFLWLPSPQAALARVAKRVSEGGHGIPEETVIRRYHAGLRNMRHLYLSLADMAFVYDNSEAGQTLVAEKTHSRVIVRDRRRWSLILKATE